MRNKRLQQFPTAIGPYLLKERLGTGGMGVVYRAHHERLDRPVALKQIRPDMNGNHFLRQRFFREARMAAQLSHPNIIQIYDIVEDQESDWLVMEFAEGETLSQQLGAGPLETGRVLGLGLDIAQGLAAAHARGIVHRDLKAENVVVAPAGRAKLLDFGLAKLQAAEMDASLSREGEVLGTPRAMSPEQASGRKVDHRSDLFSLGVLLYECLTGLSPFKSPGGFAATLSRICTHRQQPAHELEPTVPRELAELVDCLLEKDPSHRPQSAEEVVVTLQRLRGMQQAPIKILFVDDEPDLEQLIRQLYRRKIRRQEMVFEFANNGREALQKVKHDEEIALIMSDIRMPEMDGLSLLDHLQKLDRHLLTVIISAFGDMENIRTAMNLGAFDFLNKPIDFQDLELTRQKAVAEVLRIRDRHQLREENRLLAERNRLIRDALGRHLNGEFSALSGGDSGQSPLEARGKANVLRTTVVGFHALSRSLGALDLFAILTRLFSNVLDIVTRYGGTVSEFRNGTMAIVFSLPFPQDNATQRMVDCSLALRLALESVSEHSLQLGGPELMLKVEDEPGTSSSSARESQAPSGIDKDQETVYLLKNG